MNMMYNARKLSAVLLAGVLLCGCGKTEEDDSVTFVPADTTSAQDVITPETTVSPVETTTISEQVIEQTQSSSSETTTTVASDSETTTTTTSTTTSESLSESTTTSTTTQATQPQITPSGAWYDSLKLGTNCADYLASHTDYTMQEAPSCLGDGSDRVYQFSGYTLYTYFDGNQDILAEVQISQSGIPTREGAQVGMSRSEIAAIYTTGEDMVETADGTVELTYSGDTVSSISVYVIL